MQFAINVCFGNSGSGKITFPHSEIKINVLVADIMIKFILGLDMMTEFSFILDVRNKVISLGNEEVLLSVHDLKTDKIELIIGDDTRIPLNSETIVTAGIVEPGAILEQQQDVVI